MIITLHPHNGGQRYLIETFSGWRSKPLRGAIYGGARLLLAEGRCEPDELLEFQHAGSPIIAARGVAANLARWTVLEPEHGRMRKARYVKFQERPGMRRAACVVATASSVGEILATHGGVDDREASTGAVSEGAE